MYLGHFASNFLLVLLVCSVYLCSEARSKRHAHDDKDARILVLGAGMSGITAATTLIEAGYKNVQILEATDRIGGRVKDTSFGGHTVELGPSWVYGKGKNPIYHLTERFGISATDSYDDSWTVRDVNGDNVTEIGDELYDKFMTTLSEINNFAKTSPGDFNLAGALRYFNWTETSFIAEAIESYIGDFELGVSPKAHSGKHMNYIDMFEEFESYEMLVLNDERGFVNIIEQLAESVNINTTFNTVVSEIEYGNDSVSVSTLGGQTFEADFAIVTFSLGVLQQGKVGFNPPLPDMKRYAIDMFGFCSYTYVYMQFQTAFWDDTMYVVYANRFRERNGFILNMNFLYPNSNIIQFVLRDDAAIWAETTEDHIVIADIISTLEHIYPNAIIPDPMNYIISGWNHDPLHYGTWSYWPPSFTEQDMENLMAPVGRLQFAGDYAHELHYGFLQASYLSGQRVANNIIQCIEDPTMCNSYTEDWKDHHHGNVFCETNSASALAPGIGLGRWIVSCLILMPIAMYTCY